MAVRSIDKDQWNALLAGISGAVIGKRTEIEVASLDLGDQIVAERVPLVAIGYEHKCALISIPLEGVDHLIQSPRELYIDVGVRGADMSGNRRCRRDA